jgi:hypothetical protein
MFEHMGIKTSVAVAGFCGGIAALSYLRPASVWHGVGVVTCGLAGAIYWTPVAMHYIELPDSLEHAAAFTLGVTSMVVVSTILSLAEQIKTDPLGVLRKIRGGDR